jgi:hypothetical protein
MPAGIVGCYAADMQPEQKIIANWLENVRDRRGWTFEHWAKVAKIGAATTVSRAVKPEYTSVTSVKTLHALARAAEEVSILDVLDRQAKGEPIAEGAGVPSEETLARLLAVVLPLAPKGRTTEQSLRVVASALRHGLELLGDQSATHDERSIAVAARAAVARLRDLTQQ